MRLIIFASFACFAVAKLTSPIAGKDHLIIESNRINSNSTANAATCRDPDLARFINNALASYVHNMDGLTKSILNQIVASRKAGQWLVHAQVISSSRQGPDWQTTTNSAVFSGSDAYACFFHDMQTYILVLRVY